MGFLAGPPTLTNSDEWPVKRHQQHQDYRFDHSQPESDFKQIPGFEISIRVSNDHRSRLVDKNLPTCSKGPDHAELEGIETMRLREIHEQGHGFNPLQLGMIWSFAASGKIFVYQIM